MPILRERISNSVELCNAALFDLKQPRITSLDIDVDGSLSAEGCRLNYYRVLDSLLSEYNWDFAISSEKLVRGIDSDRRKNPDGSWAETESQHSARVSSYNLIGYNYAYSMPPDNLRLVRAYDGSNAPLAFPEVTSFPAYRYERNLVFTNEQEVRVRYVSAVLGENFNNYSALFKDLFLVELTAKLSYAFEDSSSRFESRSALAEMLRKKAKAMSSQQTLSDFCPITSLGSFRDF